MQKYFDISTVKFQEDDFILRTGKNGRANIIVSGHFTEGSANSQGIRILSVSEAISELLS